MTNSDFQCLTYLIALLGAGIGAWVAITIAKDAPTLPGYPKQPAPISGEPPQNPQ